MIIIEDKMNVSVYFYYIIKWYGNLGDMLFLE